MEVIIFEFSNQSFVGFYASNFSEEARQESDEELRMKEEMTRQLFNPEDKFWDFGRKRATDNTVRFHFQREAEM